MSISGNPMLAGKVQRYVGLERARHVMRHVGGGRYAVQAPVFPNPGFQREGIKDFLGTSTMVKTRTRKRPRYSRKKKGLIRRRVPRALAPRTKLVRLKATEYVNQTHTSGALTATGTQLNSIDDVFQGSSNQQPLGYDQYKTLYKKAIVIGSKVVVKFHNNTTSAIMVGITPIPFSQTGTPLTIYEHYMELPNTKSRILSPDVDHTTMFHKVSTKKHLHLSKLKDNEEVIIDLVNETPPTKLAQWHIWSQPLDQTTTTSSTALQAVITMEYLVLLIDPIIPARSTDT